MRAIHLLLATALGVGCGGTGGEADPATPAGAPGAGAVDSAVAPPVATPTDQPPADTRDSVVAADLTPAPGPQRDAGGWTTGPIRSARPAAGVATIVAVRIASHQEFDRLVVEFAGDTIPGYGVERIVAPARQCGSGNPVEIAGDGLLQLRMEPARAHTDEGEPTLVQRRWPVGLPVVRDVMLTCDFEAQVELVAGVVAPVRYRVMELASPARLVLDVRRD